MSGARDWLTPEEVGAAVLEAHNGLRGYLLDSPQHALVMLLADLVEYAEAQQPPCDLDAALAAAREVVSDCRS